MTLRTQMQADVSAVFLNTDEHAETVSYTPSGGSARNIPAVIEDEMSADIRFGEDGKGIPKSATLYVDIDDTVGVDDPTVDADTFTFRSTVWKLKEVERQDGMWRLVVASYTRKQVSRESHELQRR